MQEIIKQEEFNKKLTMPLRYEFEVESEGLYVIEIRARARGEKQISPAKTDDDDLKVEIDGRKFSSAAAFSGGEIHSLEKIVYFVICLSGGKHFVEFIPDKAPMLESISIQFVGDAVSEFDLAVKQTAEDGDRRPWITIALVGMPLRILEVEAIASWRFRDGDDLKLVIDGVVQKNKSSVFWKDWLWSSSMFKKLFSTETQTETIKTDLPTSPHTIEFWADRTPSINKIHFDFGASVKRIPDVYDPKWTGEFKDDTEDILLARLILGEAEGEPKEAKIWVGCSVLSRVKSTTAWPNTIRDVILQPGQYDPIKPVEGRHAKIIDPLRYTTPIVWENCYEIAKGLISGAIKNDTTATHFHGIGVTQDWFMRNVVPKGKFLKRIGNTHFYWSLN